MDAKFGAGYFKYFFHFNPHRDSVKQAWFSPLWDGGHGDLGFLFRKLELKSTQSGLSPSLWSWQHPFSRIFPEPSTPPSPMRSKHPTQSGKATNTILYNGIHVWYKAMKGMSQPEAILINTRKLKTTSSSLGLPGQPAPSSPARPALYFMLH